MIENQFSSHQNLTTNTVQKNCTEKFLAFLRIERHGRGCRDKLLLIFTENLMTSTNANATGKNALAYSPCEVSLASLNV
jgi:hypothetical protein